MPLRLLSLFALVVPSFAFATLCHQSLTENREFVLYYRIATARGKELASGRISTPVRTRRYSPEKMVLPYLIEEVDPPPADGYELRPEETSGIILTYQLSADKEGTPAKAFVRFLRHYQSGIRPNQLLAKLTLEESSRETVQSSLYRFEAWTSLEPIVTNETANH